MAVANIGHVTRAFIDIIQRAVNDSGNWAPSPPVLPEPPNRIRVDGIGFYLYHVQETAHYKNMPSPGNDIPPVRFTPMPLTLYYQLSANSIRNDGESAYDEQSMMGVAMKALHDYPFLDDDTKHKNGDPVFSSELTGRDNRFRITIQPIPYGEAVHHWTAGSAPIKLSAYYEISVVFLEPEPVLSYAGRVLTYNTLVFSQWTPRIFSSQNTILYTLPGEATPRQIELHPAQASPGSQIDFIASGIIGNLVELRLFNT